MRVGYNTSDTNNLQAACELKVKCQKKKKKRKGGLNKTIW